MYIHCRNSKCINYFEDGCMKDLKGKMVAFDENGKCEDYKPGINDAYLASDVREEVYKYAHAMEKELKENDHKGGWKGCDLEFLFDKLNEEVNELKEAADRLDSMQLTSRTPKDEIEGQSKRTLSEAADVGNIAMMIADVLNALK